MRFEFDEEKNKRLLSQRNVRFEDAIAAIADDRILKDFPHPNQEKYPDQRLMVLNIDDYAYCVPYRKLDGKTILLITMYPNRKFKSLIDKETKHG